MGFTSFNPSYGLRADLGTAQRAFAHPVVAQVNDTRF
jgi:hypothetical protein